MFYYKTHFVPIGLLAGTIIGAGIFSLPFVFASAGLSIGFVALFVGAVVFFALHLLYADIILRTPGTHRFVGYVQIYLGPWASRLALLASVPQMLLVLTIYLVLAAKFGDLLFPGFGILSLCLFWIIGSAFIFFNLRTLASFELLMTGGIVAIIAALFFFAAPYIPTIPSRFLFPRWGVWFLPFAPVLFALSGRVAIPSLIRYFRELGGHDVCASVRVAIGWGTIVPAILYGFFVVAVVALSPIVSDDAVTGLLGAIPLLMLAALGVLGLLSLLSSYVVVGLDISNILEYDFRVSLLWRGVVVLCVPLLIYLAGFTQFIPLVSFAGGVFLSLEGILIALTWFCLPAHSRERCLVGRWGPLLAWGTLIVFVVAFFATLVL